MRAPASLQPLMLGRCQAEHNRQLEMGGAQAICEDAGNRPVVAGSRLSPAGPQTDPLRSFPLTANPGPWFEPRSGSDQGAKLGTG
jgi:hypothetical protein